MSDIANAPAAAPPAPPPAQSEVPINPNPVSAPQPISNQAPDKPDGAKPERKLDRRESIQRAFEKAEASRPKPEARKARIGDNHPPEEIDREKPKIDLRKPPSDQPKAEPRERAEHGHFAPRQQEGREPLPADRGVAPQQAPRHAQLPEGTPYQHPPQRMTEFAKSQWAATPEPVRADVHRIHSEFQRAYERYRPDVETFQTIKHFAQQAAQQGTTLERALTSYTQMENKLRQDPIGGLDIIVNNLNLRAEDGTKLGLRDVAYAILSQTPEQQKLVQSSNAQNAQSQQIGQLHQMVNTLATGIQQMQYQQTFTRTRSAVDQYADTHPRFDELGPAIEREIKLGFNLDQAYARADRLYPATHADQTRNTPAQTRPTARSISGAPAGPSNGTGRRPDKPVGRREAIANAMKRANNSF